MNTIDGQFVRAIGELAAALNRLEMARQWIESQPHTNRCPWRGLAKNAAGYRPPCTCGRDALLEALEMPR